MCNFFDIYSESMLLLFWNRYFDDDEEAAPMPDLAYIPAPGSPSYKDVRDEAQICAYVNYMYTFVLRIKQRAPTKKTLLTHSCKAWKSTWKRKRRKSKKWKLNRKTKEFAETLMMKTTKKATIGNKNHI